MRCNEMSLVDFFSLVRVIKNCKSISGKNEVHFDFAYFSFRMYSYEISKFYYFLIQKEFTYYY